MLWLLTFLCHEDDRLELRKACYQGSQVMLYDYNVRATRVWWQQNQPFLSTHENLSVRFIDDGQLNALANLAQRNMVLQSPLQEGLILLSNVDSQLQIALEQW